MLSKLNPFIRYAGSPTISNSSKYMRVGIDNRIFYCTDGRGVLKFENEISKILKHFQTEREITITQEEDDKLKLFFAIMAFRSQTTYDMFHKMISKESDNG